MIEPLRTWILLQQLRSHVHVSPQRLKKLQDSLFREALLRAYQQVPFYRRYWDEEGFDPRSVCGSQDLERVPIMTSHMARIAAEQGELVARKHEWEPPAYLYTTGSTGQPKRITKGRYELRLWRAQGLRIWLEHGFHWRHMKAQFNVQTGTTHVMQRLGISRTRWISPNVPLDELRDLFLEAKADWLITTPTILRRLASALADAGGHFPAPRGVFCQGELVDTQTRDLCRKIFGVMPVDVYTQTELGYVAWQCERRESLHVNADTHLVEVLRKGEAAGPGELGSIVVTDLRNRAMPFLRYDTGDLAIAGNGSCSCGRQFPCLQSIEGRQRDAIQLKDGCIITPRSLVNHLAQVLPLDRYRLHQETTTRFRLELFSAEGQAVGTGRHEPPGLPDSDVIVNHLRALLGDVEISIQTTTTPRTSGEKNYPIVVNCLAPIA